jgi:hypothetical protein
MESACQEATHMLDEADGGEAMLTASRDTGRRLVIPAPAGVPRPVSASTRRPHADMAHVNDVIPALPLGCPPSHNFRQSR